MGAGTCGPSIYYIRGACAKWLLSAPLKFAAVNWTHSANERKRESEAENGATRGAPGETRRRKALAQASAESGPRRKWLEFLAINAKARGYLASGYIVNWFGWATRGRRQISPNVTLQATLALRIYRPLRFQANATGRDNGVCDLSGLNPSLGCKLRPREKSC